MFCYDFILKFVTLISEGLIGQFLKRDEPRIDLNGPNYSLFMLIAVKLSFLGSCCRTMVVNQRKLELRTLESRKMVTLSTSLTKKG